MVLDQFAVSFRERFVPGSEEHDIFQLGTQGLQGRGALLFVFEELEQFFECVLESTHSIVRLRVLREITEVRHRDFASLTSTHL